jgi:hypothetical protein
MIRRGFWLAVGATLGITGYRKATRLARTLTGQPATGLAGQRPGSVTGPGSAWLAGREERALPAAGQEPDSAGQPAQRAGASGGRQRAWLSAAHRNPAAPPWPVRLVAGARVAAEFVRDVREGMADYRDLHGEQLARSLGSQAGQIASGRSPRDTRER